MNTPPAIIESAPMTAALNSFFRLSSPSSEEVSTERICLPAVKMHQEQAFRRHFTALRDLANLAEGWDGYDAPSPSKTARNTAKQILLALQNQDFTPDRVVATVDGGVSIVFVRQDRYADIECFSNGEILAGMSTSNNAPVIHAVNLANVAVKLRSIRAFINPRDSEATFAERAFG